MLVRDYAKILAQLPQDIEIGDYEVEQLLGFFPSFGPKCVEVARDMEPFVGWSKDHWYRLEDCNKPIKRKKVVLA